MEMSYRFMRVLVFFDLPVVSTKDRREYTKFRKYLIKNGFMMLQESVYVKLALNTTAADIIMTNIKRNKPPLGLVQMLLITEKQFSRMEFVIGESVADVVDSDERLIII